MTDDGIHALQPKTTSNTPIVEQVGSQETGDLSKRVLKETAREFGLWVDNFGASLRKQGYSMSVSVNVIYWWG